MKEQLRIILLDSPRTCSQLFRRMFEPHPALSQIIHGYVAPAKNGPERLGRLLKHCDAAEEIQLKGTKDPTRGGISFDQMNKIVLGKVQAIEAEEGKVAWLKEHCPFLVKEDIILSSFREGVQPDVTRNPTVLPDDFLDSLTPIILIRHPALVWASWYRLGCSKVMGYVTSDEDFHVLGSMRWTKIMYDYYRGQGRRTQDGIELPLVVDAEDLVNDSRAVLDKVGRVLGIDPSGLRDEWPEGFSESHGWSTADPLREAALGALMSTKGVTGKHKQFQDIDLDQEEAEWSRFGKDAAGNDVAKALRKIVDAEMPVYEYLRQHKLKI